MNQTKSLRVNKRLLPKVYWSSIVFAGSIAGTLFMVIHILLTAIFDASAVWRYPKMIAAILLGENILNRPEAFEFGIFLIAFALHIALSITFTYFLALFIKGRSLTKTMLISLMFGLSLYLINFYGFSALFPWFAEARNWILIITHVLFSAIATTCYFFFTERAKKRNNGN